uniref:GAG-pre-integrase domain-containing protein n=1 Tax=Peronospora matthiolae TaxID=2874970 RepID=A0AAV1U3T5_9STRA
MQAIGESQPREATVQTGSLMSFHRSFGHLSYKDIKRLVENPANGLELTDKVRENCLTCSEDKQSKSAQPKKNSGLNEPIDVVGGVICSDLIGPMTPIYKRINRHLINFIDHKSNYVRVVVAKSKDEAARKFQHFMVFI